MEDRFLRYIPLFQGLPEEQVKRLAESGRYKNFKSGELIAGEEEKVKALFLVVWGKVKIFRGSEKEQTIYLFGPGELFCLTSLADEPFPASAMALDDTRVLVLPSDMLEDMAKREPSLLFNMLITLIRRLKESMHLIELLSLKEIPQRLASFLLHSLALQGGGDVLALTISQRELAKILGTTPETLSRVLKKMGSDGMIAVKGRSIRMRDRAALERLSEGTGYPHGPQQNILT